jgi:hypothetical protein
VLYSHTSLIPSDHASRVASLNLDSEGDIPWDELVNESWKSWTVANLRKKWVELRATVDASTHRSE